MKYEKPEITAIHDAVETVQGFAKMGQHFDTRPSNGAYSGMNNQQTCRALLSRGPAHSGLLKHALLRFDSAVFAIAHTVPLLRDRRLHGGSARNRTSRHSVPAIWGG